MVMLCALALSLTATPTFHACAPFAPSSGSTRDETLAATTLGPGSIVSAPLRSAAARYLRRPFVTYITGDLPGAKLVFRLEFHPAIPFSGVLSAAAIETRGFSLDGIDFVPGTGFTEVAVGAPTGILSHYDVISGATLTDYIVDTDLVAVPPASPGTWPSTVWSTPLHLYYVENQFGFGATASHRIMRKPFAGGAESVVYDGAVHGLKNFEGLEGVAGRLYFFAADPFTPGFRALISIGVTPAGVWNGLPFSVAIPGLTEAPGPATDGSDEIDLDPTTGLLFGTNIVNGEMIAYDPLSVTEVSSPGAVHFVDGGQIAASSGTLALLGGAIDGIRSAGHGWLIVTGKAGVILTVSIGGVLGDGADDGDVNPIVMMPGAASFDDLTPVVRE